MESKSEAITRLVNSTTDDEMTDAVLGAIESILYDPVITGVIAAKVVSEETTLALSGFVLSDNIAIICLTPTNSSGDDIVLIFPLLYVDGTTNHFCDFVRKSHSQSAAIKLTVDQQLQAFYHRSTSRTLH